MAKVYSVRVSPKVEACNECLSWALPNPTSFSCLDTRKRSKRKSRLMFRADPLNVIGRWGTFNCLNEVLEIRFWS